MRTRKQIEERIEQLRKWIEIGHKRRMWPQVIAAQREIETLCRILKLMEELGI